MSARRQNSTEYRGRYGRRGHVQRYWEDL